MRELAVKARVAAAPDTAGTAGGDRGEARAGGAAPRATAGHAFEAAPVASPLPRAGHALGTTGAPRNAAAAGRRSRPANLCATLSNIRCTGLACKKAPENSDNYIQIHLLLVDNAVQHWWAALRSYQAINCLHSSCILNASLNMVAQSAAAGRRWASRARGPATGCRQGTRTGAGSWQRPASRRPPPPPARAHRARGPPCSVLPSPGGRPKRARRGPRPSRRHLRPPARIPGRRPPTYRCLCILPPRHPPLHTVGPQVFSPFHFQKVLLCVESSHFWHRGCRQLAWDRVEPHMSSVRPLHRRDCGAQHHLWHRCRGCPP